MNNPDFLTASGVKIHQSESVPNFTSDAVALANFVKAKPTDLVIDAGCGGGVISLIIADKFKCKVFAVDIDAEAAALCKQNIALNNHLYIEGFNADIRTFHTHPISQETPPRYSAASYSNTANILVCNPPYFTTGRKSKDPARATARHDDTLSLPDLAASATRLLKYGGALYICYPLAQISYACQVLENNDFRVKELKLLPHLVLIHAKKSKGQPLTKVTY